jgi:hypothetical protein
LGEGFIDEFIELRVYPVKRRTEWERQDGIVAGKHGDSGSKDPSLQSREQPGNFPAIGCDEIAVGARRAEDQTLESQSPQVIAHLAGGVLADGNAEQIGDLFPQAAIVETVDQVLKQGQGQKQGHDSGLTELQCRRLLTIFVDGRLHHALDAVATQAAVVADAFDFQQAPIDLPAQLL